MCVFVCVPWVSIPLCSHPLPSFCQFNSSLRVWVQEECYVITHTGARLWQLYSPFGPYIGVVRVDLEVRVKSWYEQCDWGPDAVIVGFCRFSDAQPSIRFDWSPAVWFQMAAAELRCPLGLKKPSGKCSSCDSCRTTWSITELRCWEAIRIREQWSYKKNDWEIDR